MQLMGSTYPNANAEGDVITGDVVLGLQWAGPHPDTARAAPAVNLDAVCVLWDDACRPLEVVHPGNVRSANGGVLHTGDSPTGASTWDDERVFAFLDAIPAEVSVLTFFVVSASGHALCDVPGARCHVSNQATESALLEVELTAVGAIHHYCAATLLRCAHGWRLSTAAPVSAHLPSILGTLLPPSAPSDASFKRGRGET